ncbi:MAG: MobA/MobL family protein [Oscillospiraceae bacterium]|nr:MobA/MobL family protein [Oscillospiraceae bacterium]
MAIYHCSIKIISRGGGKSAVAAAAYRAGENITSEYDGRVNDYTRKGGIVHTEILLPENVPSEYADRSVLWNAVERIEKNKNSQLAREIEISLPRELTREQSILLVREYVTENFVDKGMCADICVHDTGKGNPHAHILLTMRPFNSDKSWGGKQRKEYILDTQGEKIYDKKKRQYKCKSIPSTDWNDQTKAEEWRSAWANVCNKHLELANSEQRIDHRSYARQGVQQIPTIHLGTVAHQLEKRGIRTERGDRNREIEITNKRLRQLKRRISKLQTWLNKAIKIKTPPTFADIVSDILNQDNGKNYNLKSEVITMMLEFLQENQIQNLTELDDKLKDIANRQYDIKKEFTPIDRRLKTLDEHLEQSDNYFKYKKFSDEYKALKKPKLQEKYRAEHRQELSSFKSAKSYLDGILNGHKTVPTQDWKAERLKLNADKSRLNGEYQALETDVKVVNTVRKIVTGEIKPPEKPYKQMNMKERMAWGKKQADKHNAQRTHTPKQRRDRGGR